MPRILFGVHPVAELLRTNPASVMELRYTDTGGHAAGEILSLASAAGVRAIKLDRQGLTRYANTPDHQGVSAFAKDYAYSNVSDMLAAAESAGRQPLIVALDNVQDPRNLGSIIRSSYLLGAHGVIFPKDRSAQVTPLVSKASAGATEHMRIAAVPNLARALRELKDRGLWVAGTDMSGGVAQWRIDFTLPMVVVIGGEGEGMRRLTHKSCDYMITIPSVDAPFSLNASVAASVILSEAARQRSPSE